MLLNATIKVSKFGRRGLHLGAAVALLSAGMVGAQTVKAPRYTGNIEAPVQQPVLPPLPPAITPNATVVEDVVARINDQIISRSDVERSEAQLQQENTAQNVNPTEATTRQRDMLRDMIDQQLLLSKAKELNLNADADLIRQLDDIRKQNNFATMDDLERAARQQGVSFEDFKAKIKNQILTQQVVREEVGRRLQLTPNEENAYYQDHKNEFNQPEQVRLSEILVPLPETATDDQIHQAELKANGLKTQIAQGVNFADLAKKSSGGPTAAQGGELGLFKRGALAKVLEDQTFELKPEESTQPIRTRQGYVILKVTAHQQAGPAPLKDVEPQVQEAIYMSQMQPALRAYLTKLREQAYVNIAPGFVDSGSSGKETQPILFTAYTPPAIKKKVVQDKARFDRRGYVPVSAASTRQVADSPDTTGGRTLTGKEAASGGVAPAPTDPNTGLALISAPRNGTSGKAKKLKREKLRYGQAPRVSLASAGEDVAAPGAVGVVAAPAPGAAMASGGLPGIGQSDTADLADNPLTPKHVETGKVRFAQSAEVHKENKLRKTALKQQEKLAAKPVEMTADEKEAAQAQASPLGLAGDTTKKSKAAKRAKGQPKERLEDKKVEKDTSTPVPLTANPALAPTNETSDGKTAAPKADSTTLPPVTTPVQGQPQQGPTTPQQQLPGSIPQPPH